MRGNSSNFRTTFLFIIFLGSFFNLFQVLKLRTGRRIDIGNADLDGVIRTKQHFSLDKDNHLISQQRSNRGPIDLVKPNDFVYSAAWDASPIVIESHKLVFFTVPKAG